MSSLLDKFTTGVARLLPLGKQANDPLANIKAATRWLESLPSGDTFKRHQTLFNELKRLNEAPEQLFTFDRLAILKLLDERSRYLQDTLIRQYLRNPRMSRLLESQLWHAIYGLHWEIARGYHTFVLRLSHEPSKNPLRTQLPVITLRAVQAFGQLLKWRSLRYLPGSEKLWIRLHNLYRIAETNDFHTHPLRAYAENPAECSCESAYVHILMLDLANSGTLYPKQLDQLDRWLDSWHDQLHFDSQLDAETHNFSVDLSVDQGGRRVRKPDTDKPMRYWSTIPLLLKLQDLHAALKKSSKPAQLGLGENARTAESLELLDYLLRQWDSLDEREQRRAPRESIKRLVDIAHGLTAIVDQIKVADAPVKTSPYGAGLNYSEADDMRVYGYITERTRERVSQLYAPALPESSDVERWVMHDESDCGFGAVVESRNKDWLRVGALISVRAHESNQWKIGIVRRLTRINSETSSVGIETLPALPSLAMLYDTGAPDYTAKGADGTPFNLPNAGLLLVDSASRSSLILDPAHYLPGKVCQINGAPKLKLISLGKPIENSVGWVHVTAEPLSG